MSELTKRIESLRGGTTPVWAVLAELAEGYDETRRRVEALEQRAEQDGRAVNCECNVSDLPCPVHPTAPPTLTDRLRQIGDTLCNLTHEVRMLNVDTARAPVASSGGETTPRAVPDDVMDAVERILGNGSWHFQDAELLARFIRESAAGQTVETQPPAPPPAGEAWNPAFSSERGEEWSGALRELASYYGAGGYNAPDPIDARVFVEKVKGGAEGINRQMLAWARDAACSIVTRLAPEIASKFSEELAESVAFKQAGTSAASPPPGEWTLDVPTKEDWYWYRRDDDMEPIPVFLFKSVMPSYGGERSVAPLPPPGEPGKMCERSLKAAALILYKWADSIPANTALSAAIRCTAREIESLAGQSIPAGDKP